MRSGGRQGKVQGRTGAVGIVLPGPAAGHGFRLLVLRRGRPAGLRRGGAVLVRIAVHPAPGVRVPYLDVVIGRGDTSRGGMICGVRGRVAFGQMGAKKGQRGPIVYVQDHGEWAGAGGVHSIDGKGGGMVAVGSGMRQVGLPLGIRLGRGLAGGNGGR